jgi:hypothetical protein
MNAVPRSNVPLAGSSRIASRNANPSRELACEFWFRVVASVSQVERQTTGLDEQRKSAPPLDRYRFASKRESPSWSAAVVCRANRLFDAGRGIDREQLPHQLASLRRGLRATGTARCRHFFATFFVAAPRRSMRRAADCRQASRSRFPRNAASYGKRLSASDGTRTRDLRRDRLEVGVVPRSERSPNSTRDGA